MLYVIAFILAVFGIVLLCRINSKQIVSDISSLTHKNRTLEYKVRQARGEIKTSKFTILLREMQSTLVSSHSENRFAIICVFDASVLLIVICCCVLLHKFFFIPAFVLVAFVVPVVYVRNLAADLEKQFSFELETSLNFITSAYVGSGDIVAAVSDSLPDLREPIRSVFTRFLGRAKAIDCDIIASIDTMSYEIKNDIFKEWCNSLKECYRNSDLRYILQPTVMKFTDERIVNAQLETKLTSERKDFYMMLFLTLVNFPLLYLLNADWFSVLVDTTIGQIVSGAVLVACVFITLRMKALTKPVKYRR